MWPEALAARAFVGFCRSCCEGLRLRVDSSRKVREFRNWEILEVKRCGPKVKCGIEKDVNRTPSHVTFSRVCAHVS